MHTADRDPRARLARPAASGPDTIAGLATRDDPPPQATFNHGSETKFKPGLLRPPAEKRPENRSRMSESRRRPTCHSRDIVLRRHNRGPHWTAQLGGDNENHGLPEA